MPLIRAPKPTIASIQAAISDPASGADTAALRLKIIEILQALRNDGIIAIAAAAYYDVIQGFSPYALLKLEDTNANAKSFAGATIGTYSGTYSQEQASLLSDNSGKSVQFNNGAIALSQQIAAPSAFTVICRFKASDSASGGLFGFSNAATPAPGTAYDRAFYMGSDGKINFYSYSNGFINLATSGSYRDNQPHTFVARVGAGQSTAIFIDGVKVAETTSYSLDSYTGSWKIGFAGYYAGFPASAIATGITIQGAAIVHSALTDAQIATIHAAV